jgi:hypothetical protein
MVGTSLVGKRARDPAFTAPERGCDEAGATATVDGALVQRPIDLFTKKK